ncbi:MAG: nickel pincer cofactor biosynthesis protein LarC [Euryarchaeota archaeon]|nr:nickel pincer cofactor biosynthesis protein LarC [Euryarchaeota archaeon]
MVVILDAQNSGIAGNMVVGALLDLGVDPDALIDIMEQSASNFGDISVEIKNVGRSGIAATLVDVKCKDKEPVLYTELIDKLNKIENEIITTDILQFSKKVFNTIAEAESKVHGISLDKIHFHEVGAADAVADVFGAAYCFYELGLDGKKVYGMPVALGGGRVETMHGRLSVPAPATLEILRGVPVFGGPVDYELTTPTGAALYVNMVDEFCDFYPLITNRKIGYGAGKLDLDISNVLRVLIGDSTVPTDKVSIIETNIDNVTGEVLGHLFERLMDKGALDVTLIPAFMKKNRPGHLLRVITTPNDCNILAEAVIRETGTLGVRVMPYVHRNIVERKIVPIKVDLMGIEKNIRIKVGMIENEVISATPEYEDAKKISKELNIPLKDVIKKANETFKKFRN